MLTHERIHDPNMISDKSRYEGDRYTECHRSDEIFPYIDLHLTNISESDRRSVWGEFDNENSKNEIRLYEMIEFLDEYGFFLVFDSCAPLEYMPTISPDTIEQEISEDITHPTEYEYEEDIKNSKRCEKCCNESHNRSLDDHENQHKYIASSLEGCNSLGI